VRPAVFLDWLDTCVLRSRGPFVCTRALDQNRDGRLTASDFHHSDVINVHKLTDMLAFEDERRTALCSALVFFLFSLIYIIVLDMQFNTQESFYMSQALRDFVDNIDQDGKQGTGIEDIAAGEDVLLWIRDGLLEAVFGDIKYNDQKMALWERNYLARFNKVIGGVFLLQTRGERSDMRHCETKFGQFYPACYTEHGESLPFGPQYEENKDKKFSEALVMQAALGKDTTTEKICTELATGTLDGKFCLSCIKTMNVDGLEVDVFSSEGDCGLCKPQCLTLVAPKTSPIDYGVLTPDQVCAFCMFGDKATFDGRFPKFPEHYARGLRDLASPTGGPNPLYIYGWETGYSNSSSKTEVLYPVCAKERDYCLGKTCDRCMIHPALSEESLREKEEGACDSLFSGGPVPDSEGKLYDCGVRLAAGARGAGSSLAGDGVKSGRVELKHNGVWGTVCTRDWDDTDASVLCKSLGYEGGGTAVVHTDACLDEARRDCDPPPGPDYDVAVQQPQYAGTVPSPDQCMYCAAQGEELCNVRITVIASLWGSENSFTVVGADGGQLFHLQMAENNQVVNQELRQQTPGSLSLEYVDSYGDGWHPQFEGLSNNADCLDWYNDYLGPCRVCLWNSPGSMANPRVHADCATECASGPPGPSQFACIQAAGNSAAGSIVLTALTGCFDHDADSGTPDQCTETITHVQYVSIASGAQGTNGWSGSINFQCGSVASANAQLSCAYADCKCVEYTERVCDAPFGRGKGPVWLAGVSCDGKEDSLCSCTQGSSNRHLDWGAGDWMTGCNGHTTDVGVICKGQLKPQPERIQDCSGICIPKKFLGDGWCDAGSRGAELNCEQMSCDAGDCDVACEPAPVPCPLGQWRCGTGACIDGARRCDNVPHCTDKSDERNCEGVFCCHDGTRCIAIGWVNDGWPDCQDASDEPNGLLDKYTFNLKNGYCRAVLPMCDMYLQDRGMSCSATILPGEGCSPQPGDDENGVARPPEWHDGTCQALCGTEKCKYDGGDCPVGLDMLACDRLFTPGECTQHNQIACTVHSQCKWQGTTCLDDPDGFYWDGKCDMRFNNSACNWDNGECLKCSWDHPRLDCHSDFLGDGFCDAGCMIAACGWDHGDCPSADTGSCPVSYSADSVIGDGTCDPAFNTLQCGCDAGDCNDNGEVGLKSFKCIDGREIWRDDVCNGKADCAKGEDEAHCSPLRTCPGIVVHIALKAFGNEAKFSIDGGFRYGDPTRACKTGCCDGQTHCQPFRSHKSEVIVLQLAPGPHNITMYDIAGDSWGAGAYLEVLQSSSSGGVPFRLAGGSEIFATNFTNMWSEATLDFTVNCTVPHIGSVVLVCPGTASRTLEPSRVCDGVADCPGGEDEFPGCTFTCSFPPCAQGCSHFQLGDGFCDPACYSRNCKYDHGDCAQCKEGCYDWLRNDGVCNPECATPSCLYDGVLTKTVEGGGGKFASDCDPSHLGWAQSVLAAELVSQETYKSSATLKVSSTFLSQVFNPAGTAHAGLLSSTQSAIADSAAVLLGSVAVTLITAGQAGRRRAQSESSIVLEYTIKCLDCASIAQVLVPSNTVFTRRIVNQATVVAHTLGFTNAIVSTADDVATSLGTSVVIGADTNSAQSVICLDAPGGGPDAWRTEPCMYSHQRDGQCQCQCLGGFRDSPSVCVANDESSGDCSDEEVLACLGWTNGSSVCPFKVDEFSCMTHTQCFWQAETDVFDQSKGEQVTIPAHCTDAGPCNSGINMTATNGTISYNFDEGTAYPSNAHCRWNVPCATAQATLNIDYAIEQEWDFITITDFDRGWNATLTGDSSQQYDRSMCGGGFQIEFESDAAANSRGFQMHYRCHGSAWVDGGCASCSSTEPCPTGFFCPDTTGSTCVACSTCSTCHGCGTPVVDLNCARSCFPPFTDLTSLTSPYSGSTTGRHDLHTLSCGSNGLDQAFSIQVPPGHTLTIGITSNAFDSIHELRYGESLPGNTVVVCRDDPDTMTETWTNTLSTTEAAYFHIDAFSHTDGAFTLAWSIVECPVNDTLYTAVAPGCAWDSYLAAAPGSRKWYLSTSATPSSNTGPDNDHSGSTFHYLEASNSDTNPHVSGDISYLWSASFVANSAQSVSFYYHMYGSSIGFLAVEAAIHGTWASTGWNVTGQQHTDGSDLWTLGQLMLPLDCTRIRFVGQRSNGWEGDMAIDTVTFSTDSVPFSVSQAIRLTSPGPYAKTSTSPASVSIDFIGAHEGTWIALFKAGVVPGSADGSAHSSAPTICQAQWAVQLHGQSIFQGRCGPLYNNCSCSEPMYPYCSESSGWCGYGANYRDENISTANDFVAGSNYSYHGLLVIPTNLAWSYNGSAHGSGTVTFAVSQAGEYFAAMFCCSWYEEIASRLQGITVIDAAPSPPLSTQSSAGRRQLVASDSTASSTGSVGTANGTGFTSNAKISAGRRLLVSTGVDGSECRPCTPVAHAVSVTCDLPGISRVVACAAGFTRVDKSASGASDACTIAPKTCVANYDDAGGGAFPASSCTTGYVIKAPLPNTTCAWMRCFAVDCCDDIDGCAGSPCVGAGSTCKDTPAPGTGYLCTCAAGFYGDASTSTGHGCAPCTPVSHAVSVTCSAANMSRAVCEPGYLHIDRSASNGSDVCAISPIVNCKTNSDGNNGSFASTSCTAGWAPKILLPPDNCTSNTCTVAECCDDIDGCATNPCASGRSVCTDVQAPGLGHECKCAHGYAGTPGSDGNGCVRVNNLCSQDFPTDASCPDGSARISSGRSAPCLEATCTAAECCQSTRTCAFNASVCPPTTECTDTNDVSTGFRCKCAPGWYSILATERASSSIPAGWSSGRPAPAQPPPPPPVPARVQALQSSAPAPPMVLNTTAPPPPPKITGKALNGFTPTCAGEDDPTSPLEGCDPEKIRYMYFLPITKDVRLDDVRDRMTDNLIQNLWIDSQTSDVEVRFVTYNGNLKLFAVVRIHFQFNLGGKVSKSVDVQTLNLELDREKFDWDTLFTYRFGGVLTLLESMLLFYVLCTAAGEFKDVIDAWKFLGSPLKYFVSVWNYFDMAQVWSFIMCGIYWAYLLQYSNSVVIGQRYDWSPSGPLDEDGQTAEDQLLKIIAFVMSANSAMHGYTVFSVCNLILTQLRFFKYARFQPQLSIVNRTFRRMVNPLAHFMVILCVLLFVLSIQAKLIFGRDLEYVSDWYGAMETIFLASLGVFEMALLEEGWMGLVYFYTVMVMVFFILINFFLAIVMEAYDAAKDEIRGGNSIMKDCLELYEYCRRTRFGFRMPDTGGRRLSILEDERGFSIDVRKVHERGIPAAMQRLMHGTLERDGGGGASKTKSLLRKDPLKRLQPEDFADRLMKCGEQTKEATFNESDVADLIRWYLHQTKNQDGEGKDETAEERLEKVEQTQQEILSALLEIKRSVDGLGSGGGGGGGGGNSNDCTGRDDTPERRKGGVEESRRRRNATSPIHSRPPSERSELRSFSV
jgi:hypothetical protein